MKKLHFLVVGLLGLVLNQSVAPAQTTPTDYEQYILELINRARANPTAEVTRLSGQTWGDPPGSGTNFEAPDAPELNEGMPTIPITSVAKQPLAFNLDLIQAARAYSNTLLSNNSNLDHTFPNDTTSPSSRDQAAGYNGTAGENLAITESSATLPISTTVAESLHDQLFIDGGTLGRGHRDNIMDSTSGYQEIGIGLASSSTYQAPSPFPNAVLVTEDFGVPAVSTAILTGVVFTDLQGRNFYAPGEGMGNVTITATPSGGGGGAQTTTTWSSGGYSLPLAAGTYVITATGSFGTDNLGTDTLTTQNVEADLALPAPEPASLGLILIGSVGFLRRRRRRRRA
jgi:hypothetical protein